MPYDRVYCYSHRTAARETVAANSTGSTVTLLSYFLQTTYSVVELQFHLARTEFDRNRSQVRHFECDHSLQVLQFCFVFLCEVTYIILTKLYHMGVMLI